VISTARTEATGLEARLVGLSDAGAMPRGGLIDDLVEILEGPRRQLRRMGRPSVMLSLIGG